MTANGPTEDVERGLEIPMLMVSPHADRLNDATLWPEDLVNAVVDHVIETQRVDEERIYLTGLSVGAEAVWRVAASRPYKYAALVPVCGYGDPEDAKALPHMAVWMFHGGLDFVCLPRGSYEMLRAHREAGGNPRFTLYPAHWHFVWKPVYKRGDLYQWLLEQRRARPPATPGSPRLRAGPPPAPGGGGGGRRATGTPGPGSS